LETIVPAPHAPDRKESAMRPVIETFAAALLGTAVLLSVAPANAQSPTPPTQKPAAPGGAIADNKLDAAAAALQQVTTLRQSYQQKIEAAPPDQQQRIATEGNNALKKAVTDHGLSVDEYNRILQVAQNDPTVRAKLLSRLTPKQ
jgi:Spy/CpxP family protein refolding chaperone